MSSSLEGDFQSLTRSAMFVQMRDRLDWAIESLNEAVAELKHDGIQEQDWVCALRLSQGLKLEAGLTLCFPSSLASILVP